MLRAWTCLIQGIRDLTLSRAKCPNQVDLGQIETPTSLITECSTSRSIAVDNRLQIHPFKLRETHILALWAEGVKRIWTRVVILLKEETYSVKSTTAGKGLPSSKPISQTITQCWTHNKPFSIKIELLKGSSSLALGVLAFKIQYQLGKIFLHRSPTVTPAAPSLEETKTKLLRYRSLKVTPLSSRYRKIDTHKLSR